MNGVTRFLRRLFRPGSTAPVVTWTIAAVCVLVWLLELLPATQAIVVNSLIYAPFLTPFEPWRMLTAAFLHSPSSIFHILFNMYTLLVFGPVVEAWVGRWRFVVLYLLAAFGGSVAVLWLASPGSAVLGASGAVFGLLAAVVVIQRGLGSNPMQLVVVIVLNLAIGFFTSGVSWQAHLGGLAVGAVVGWVYLRTRGPRQRQRQIGWLVGVVAALLVLTLLGVIVKL